MDIINLSAEEIGELEFPSSIRTPGRTWTRYPRKIEELLEDAPEEVDPEIESEGDIEVFKGQEAIEKAGDQVFEMIDPEDNKINALHANNLNSIIYVKVKGRAELHINYKSDLPALSHLVVDAEDNSDVLITEQTENTGSEFNTSFTEIYVGENASVEYGAVEKAGEFSYSHRKAVVDLYGSINWLNGIFSGDLNRTKIETILKGDNSETEMTGVWYPTGEQHQDISLHVHHVGNNTKCDMDSRSVVDHKARSLYEGLQQVQESAEDTQSFQDQESLMLSDDAEADASPKLMIENPNVEASHAAASGTIEEKKQHYLESRGLTDEKAERLVVKGFFEPVMAQIELPRLKETIRQEVERKLDQE